MAHFKVFIPAGNKSKKDVTLTVDAENWMGALKSGLQNAGEPGDIITHVTCDIKPDNSIHVTDTQSGRVFTLNEVADGGGPAREESEPTGETHQIGRGKSSPINVDDLIGDVFDATADLMSPGTTANQVAETLLDLALAKVPADAGTFYLADVNTLDLRFAAVRGPKADAIKNSGLTVQVGQGIIGFTAREGVVLAIYSMQNDERYFSAIADAIGYKPQNCLCAPAEKDGRLYGAIQLINTQKGSFDSAEIELLRYIGRTAGDILDRLELSR